jgi:hypothetical protein
MRRRVARLPALRHPDARVTAARDNADRAYTCRFKSREAAYAAPRCHFASRNGLQRRLQAVSTLEVECKRVHHPISRLGSRCVRRHHGSPRLETHAARPWTAAREPNYRASGAGVGWRHCSGHVAPGSAVTPRCAPAPSSSRASKGASCFNASSARSLGASPVRRFYLGIRCSRAWHWSAAIGFMRNTSARPRNGRPAAARRPRCTEPRTRPICAPGRRRIGLAYRPQAACKALPPPQPTRTLRRSILRARVEPMLSTTCGRDVRVPCAEVPNAL